VGGKSLDRIDQMPIGIGLEQVAARTGHEQVRALLLFSRYSDLDHGSLCPCVRRRADKPETTTPKREPLSILGTLQAKLGQNFGFGAPGTSFAGGPHQQLIGDGYDFDRHTSSCVRGVWLGVAAQKTSRSGRL
jgi:hypothetical protein